MSEQNHQRRFSGVEKLYGQRALRLFTQAHVIIIGVGGVGSWTVEALARSAIGKLTLIDLDHITESNINRQLHALDSTLGQAKVNALAARVMEINNQCEVHCIDDFITRSNISNILSHLVGKNCVVIDCIDYANAKAALIAWCKQQGVSVLTVGAAGACVDPLSIKLTDLSFTKEDVLLSKTRRDLRREYSFPRNVKKCFDVPAIYTDEKRRPTTSIKGGLNCAGYGSSVQVTASIGFIAAAKVLTMLIDCDNK